MQPTPPPEPAFLNLEYVFALIYRFFEGLFSINWLSVIYTVVVLIAIALITVILYSLVRLYEIKQEDDKKKKATTMTPFPVGASTGPTALDAAPVTGR